MIKTFWLSAVLAALFPVYSLAGDAKDAPASKPSSAMLSISAKDNNMMDAFMKAATPAKPHEWLAKHAGICDQVNRLWLKPAAPPTVTKGVSERSMDLGGRV